MTTPSHAHADSPAISRGRRLSLLKDIKVLDLTNFLAGPFGSMVLADMGASVLKVEQLSGDMVRKSPPYFYEGDSAYFLSVNRNKESIALDLRTPQGKEIMRRLVERADVVLDNLRGPQRAAIVPVQPRVALGLAVRIRSPVKSARQSEPRREFVGSFPSEQHRIDRKPAVVERSLRVEQRLVFDEAALFEILR